MTDNVLEAINEYGAAFANNRESEVAPKRAALLAAHKAAVEKAVGEERERIARYVESMMTPYTGTIDTGAIHRNGAALAIAAAIREKR